MADSDRQSHTMGCDDPSTCGWYRGLQAHLDCAIEAIGEDELIPYDGYIYEWAKAIKAENARLKGMLWDETKK